MSIFSLQISYFPMQTRLYEFVFVHYVRPIISPIYLVQLVNGNAGCNSLTAP